MRGWQPVNLAACDAFRDLGRTQAVRSIDHAPTVPSPAA
jgi:hypothetical protein